MKNQMYTLGHVGIRALGVLALCVSISGCSDEYTLDDEKPAWLGESIYVRLKSDGNFTNYLRLMDDIGMDTVLSRTGSRTIFAANDSAFNVFYQNNAKLSPLDPWHTATSYDRLSDNQKALLANSTMLNNAITMETLSSSSGNNIERGKYLRRRTLVSIADSVNHFLSSQLPYSYNQTGDMDYWARFRSQSYTPGIDDGTGPGIYMTDGDGTNNMMLCFTAEQMAKNNVTDDDFEMVMGQKRNPTDVYVYDAKIVQQDITCQNGYINMLGKVVRPLPNMAELIRTNGMTNIFSHILERFSVPVYVKSYNELYQKSHRTFTDTIYTKWYFSPVGTNSLLAETASGGKPVYFVTKENTKYFHIVQGATNDMAVEVPTTYSLKFDPSWNACNLVPGETDAETDMAAMFVPEDATLLEAFQRGSLRPLITEYADIVDPALTIAAQSATLENLEPLYKAIDQIPMNILQSLVNNLMRESYNGSVKSKFASLKNDAQESLFGTGGCTVSTVKLACNGAVYITKSFHAPADYSSVAAPAYMNSDKRVMRFAIYNGSGSETDYMRGLNYYAYLKAMTSRFTLFLPDDDAMLYIYQPMSFVCKNPHLVKLTYNKSFDKPGQASGEPVKCEVWDYDQAQGYMSGTRAKTNPYSMDDRAGILTDVLQTHTLVHQTEDDLISKSADRPLAERDQYYVTKSNDALKVTYNSNGSVAYVQGGFQIENEQRGFDQPEGDDKRRGTVRCHVKDRSLYQEGGNGDTYILDAPIIPAVKSVFAVMKEHEAFQPFFNLCIGINPDIIEACDFYKKENGEEMEVQDRTRLEEKTYTVFLEKNSTIDCVTAFFNQYQYSVFVPTGEALERARAGGYLYTWEDIQAQFDACAEENPDYDGSTVTQKYIIRDQGEKDVLRAKIIYLFNFIRMHFMDSSVFADNTSWDLNDDIQHQNYATSCFYQTSATQGNFMKLHIKRHGHGKMTVQGMNVAMDGLCGSEANVLDVVDSSTGINVPLRNMMAREIIVLDGTNQEVSIHNQTLSDMKNKRIGSTSSAVVHLIDQTLRYTDEPLYLDNVNNARRYLKYNKVLNKDEQ